MSSPQRMMHLNLFLQPMGHHESSWRHPGADPSRLYDATYYQELAQLGEKGKMDAVFLADSPGLLHDVTHYPNVFLEPISVLTTIASATKRIGLIGTMSTTYYEPYNVARLLNTLDHLSCGRAGWNIVSTSNKFAAPNFGYEEHPDKRQRYARAAEFTDIVLGLWDSWEDGALICDKSGPYADVSKIHQLNHSGTFLKVKGPLNAPRSPQGYPVLVQAGGSDDGRDFASRYAEVIFTVQQDLADAKIFYRDIRARAQAHGRIAEDIRILPGVSLYIGNSEAEARAMLREMGDLGGTELRLNQLERQVGVSFRDIGLDERVPLEKFTSAGSVTNNNDGRVAAIASLVKRDRPTLRDLLRTLSAARGHKYLAGTPSQIADALVEWFLERGADGFNVMPPVMPGSLQAFVDRVIPLLQERGLFRAEYAGMTLRDHLGLRRPRSQFEFRESARALAVH